MPLTCEPRGAPSLDPVRVLDPLPLPPTPPPSLTPRPPPGADLSSRGGTNLRVGFIQLLAGQPVADAPTNGHAAQASPPSRVRRHLERSWPISDQLKNDNADGLFRWIGKCIAAVVDEGCRAFHMPRHVAVPLGVTFSFPTEQRSLSEATITSMGKGFSLPPDVEFGARLRQGYGEARAGAGLPPLEVVAIANDSVATLVSFIFNYDGAARGRAAMGLILGTGSNATVALPSNRLHPSKRPHKVSVLPGEAADDVSVTVNTEWSIRGTEPPMRQLGLITPWDDELSAQNESPGFQPLEYMTAGRYLGELGRIMLLSYVTGTLGVPRGALPPALLEPHALTTTFLSRFGPPDPPRTLAARLRAAFPPPGRPDAAFAWTEHLAEALHRIARAIERRAAAITAAGVVALLTLAGELPADEGGPHAYVHTHAHTTARMPLLYVPVYAAHLRTRMAV